MNPDPETADAYRWRERVLLGEGARPARATSAIALPKQSGATTLTARVSTVGYSVVSVDEIEGAGPGRAVRFVRRELGVEAFGINWFELPPGTEGRGHDEIGSGQEEVSVVVSGSGYWRVDGTEVPVRVGSFIRFDPETVRCPVAGPDGMTFVSVGARRGSYEPRGPF